MTQKRAITKCKFFENNDLRSQLSKSGSHVVRLPMECQYQGTNAFILRDQATLLYGLARKGYPVAFTNLIRAFLLRVEVLPWDGESATVYADLRSSCAASGMHLI